MRSESLALVVAALLFLACGASSDEAAGSGAAAAQGAEAAPASSDAQADPTPARAAQPRGRPLPAFGGWTLDDKRLEISSFIGKRLVVYFFNPEVEDAIAPTRAMNAIAGLRGKYNFEIVGVAMGSDRNKSKTFVEDRGIAFPVLDDSSASISGRLGLRSPVAVLGVDAEGYVVFGMGGFGTDDPQAIESSLRTALRLPDASDTSMADHPQAPEFKGVPLDGSEPFDLKAQRGRPVVLIFFLHTCPHCHAALAFLKDQLAAIPEESRPLLVGVEVTGRTYAVREMLRERGLDFFPVLFDDDKSIQKAYGVFAGVPDTFLIDREGRIVARTQGWVESKDEPLMRMRLARLAGIDVPMVLRTHGFSGSGACGVCHEREYETWSFTAHAGAFDTLVKHGSDNDPECVSCHVVGYGKPGGFTSSIESPELEDVGCESCHGRGGPHLSPEFAKRASYEASCMGCHDPKHSLGFQYETFLPRISHAANAYIAKLPADERRKLLAERGRPGGSLLPTRADYTGSEACRSCHPAEFETWSKSGHAHALESLAKKDASGNPDCLRCHTTGFGQPGGFPQDAASGAHPDLARVGCESCHGPGGNHVAPDAPRTGTIVSLTDKCDSCVILQICGGCHDDANDPGFEFEVKAKIEAQRHGTIVPAAGPGPAGNAQQPGPGHDARLLSQAFERTDPES